MLDLQLENDYTLFQKYYMDDEFVNAIAVFENNLHIHADNFCNNNLNDYENKSYAKSLIKGAIVFYISSLSLTYDYSKAIERGEYYLGILPADIDRIISCYEELGIRKNDATMLHQALRHIEVQRTYMDAQSPAYIYDETIGNINTHLEELEKEK